MNAVRNGPSPGLRKQPFLQAPQYALNPHWKPVWTHQLPTIPGYGIAAEFAKSDQRIFLVRCPRCNQLTDIAWPAAVLGIDGQPYRARFGCPLCRRPGPNNERRESIKQGKWLQQVSGQRATGYQLSQLLSPVAKAEKLVQQWQDAVGDPSALQVFHNSVLGFQHLWKN